MRIIPIFSGMLLLSSHLAVGGTLSHEEQLGKIMFQDKDFSFNSTQSCQSCHHRTAGFADPTNARDPYLTVVSLGADGISKGGRNAPSAAYAGFSQPLAYDEARQEWYGGLFWDGRADGTVTGDPLADQAQGPPLNPVEMNMPDKDAVVKAVRDSNYVHLFETVYGPDSLADVEQAYTFISRAIAAYERSSEVQSFSSRYDRNQLTTSERRGEALFEQHCSSCHVTEDTTGQGPIFTSHGYANIGIPKNDLLPKEEPDLGLGAIVGDNAQDGKFKIPTLRNAGMSAPYGHNGYFPTLRMMVEFKNSRDVAQWPEPEVPYNLSMEVGDLGLTDGEIDDLVAFLMSLTDGQK